MNLDDISVGVQKILYECSAKGSKIEKYIRQHRDWDRWETLTDSLRTAFVSKAIEVLLSECVPLTLNANGDWIYRMHHGVDTATGFRELLPYMNEPYRSEIESLLPWISMVEDEQTVQDI